MSNWSLDYATAGGVLMDLAMENRIDTDLDSLFLIDATPIGDSLLDPTLAEIAAQAETGEKRDARFWVTSTARSAPAIREEALSRLVEEGILEHQDDRFLWVFRSRRYPSVDGNAEREVKLRIMDVLFSDSIPSPRRRGDHLLGRRLRHLQGGADPARAGHGGPRIEQVRKLDLIGQAMSSGHPGH